MTERRDGVEVAMFGQLDGLWGIQVSHCQDRRADWELAKYEDPSVDPQWRFDHYDWRGEGPITDQILGEITTLVSELMGYSLERICGLQLALF